MEEISRVSCIQDYLVHVQRHNMRRSYGRSASLLRSSGKNGPAKIFNHRRYLKPKPQGSTRNFRGHLCHLTLYTATFLLHLVISFPIIAMAIAPFENTQLHRGPFGSGRPSLSLKYWSSNIVNKNS